MSNFPPCSVSSVGVFQLFFLSPEFFIKNSKSGLIRQFYFSLLFLLLMFSGGSIQAGVAKEIVFENFSKKIIVTNNDESSDSNSYLLPSANISVALANRLIVKTVKNLDRSSVMAFDSQLNKVVELYHGYDFNYFLVELKHDASMVELLNKLAANHSVLLVQPDILQIKKNASELTKIKKINKQAYQPYIEQLDIVELWRHTLGKGVKLAIIDDGIDLAHPALVDIKTEFIYDTQTHDLNAHPHTEIDSHGTQVAGIIFASQEDSHELKGIAPDAQLIAIRQPDSWTSNTLLAFNLAKLAKADVVNCSWNTQILLEPIADVVNDMAMYGRDGKGMAVVFSAGNEGVSLAQMKTEASIESAITVGALDASGALLPSSNYGEGVDVFVYGAGVRSTTSQGGYHSFSGTSLSAAVVSGLAALLISEQPEITLKELQQKIQQRSAVISNRQITTLHPQH